MRGRPGASSPVAPARLGRRITAARQPRHRSDRSAAQPGACVKPHLQQQGRPWWQAGDLHLAHRQAQHRHRRALAVAEGHADVEGPRPCSAAGLHASTACIRRPGRPTPCQLGALSGSARQAAQSAWTTSAHGGTLTAQDRSACPWLSPRLSPPAAPWTLARAGPSYATVVCTVLAARSGGGGGGGPCARRLRLAGAAGGGLSVAGGSGGCGGACTQPQGFARTACPGGTSCVDTARWSCTARWGLCRSGSAGCDTDKAGTSGRCTAACVGHTWSASWLTAGGAAGDVGGALEGGGLRGCAGGAAGLGGAPARGAACVPSQAQPSSGCWRSCWWAQADQGAGETPYGLPAGRLDRQSGPRGAQAPSRQLASACMHTGQLQA